MHQVTKDRLKVIGLSACLVSLMGFPMAPKVEYLPPGDLGVQTADSEPAVCIGFNPDSKSWGQNLEACPANYALYGVDDPAGVDGPAEKIATRMSCCPLPNKDILLSEHSYSAESCPADSVATGMKASKESSGDKYEMRCTKINTARYQLADARPAAYWGTGAAGWKGATRIKWENIPAAIRYANGRELKDKWDVDGCVGYPFGSLLAEKHSKFCSGMMFRQLQFKGTGGDPAAGTVVKMFPDCDDVSGVDDPQRAACVKKS